MLNSILVNLAYLGLLLASLYFVVGNFSVSDSLKYLWIHFISKMSLKIDIYPFLRKFCLSVNAMTHSKCVNEDLKLLLFASFSLPLLNFINRVAQKSKPLSRITIKSY